MQKAIIGKKVGMTQIFDEAGKVIPVTVVEAGPCVVTQKKTMETDGYVAVQLGFEDIKESKLSKPEAGHLKKAGVAAKKHLKEFKLENAADMNVGDEIRLMSSLLATRLMSPASARVTATRVLSSATAHTAPT